MSMDLGGAKGGVKSDINVTPLCDVMLVLLIIMMLIAPLLQQGVAFSCPRRATRPTSRRRRARRSSRSARTIQMYVNARPVTEAEMATRVSELLENAKEKVVYIRADAESQYSAVMAAMDQLRQAGIEDIGLITDPHKKQ